MPKIPNWSKKGDGVWTFDGDNGQTILEVVNEKGKYFVMLHQGRQAHFDGYGQTEQISERDKKKDAMDRAREWMEENSKDMSKYYVEPYSFEDDTVSREEVVEMFPSLRTTLSEFDEKMASTFSPLSSLKREGYTSLAFNNVKQAYYNKEKDILVKNTEGDILVVENPTEEYIDDMLSYYPKAEVTGTGEKYDSRFPER